MFVGVCVSVFVGVCVCVCMFVGVCVCMFVGVCVCDGAVVASSLPEDSRASESISFMQCCSCLRCGLADFGYKWRPSV